MLSGLFFLGGLVLLLHQISSRLGLNILIVVLGSLIAMLQFGYPGFATILLAGEVVKISPGSYIILPTLLMGLLVIYIVNGSTQARNTFSGLILVSFLIVLFQFLPALPGNWFTIPVTVAPQNLLQPRIPLASLVALIMDMAVLVICYQSVSNWRSRFPSHFASGLALLASLLCDALIFPILAYGGTPDFYEQVFANLIGKSLAGIALWPLVVIYLIKFSPAYPGSAAVTPRPVLDIFSTHLQLEKRAGLLYNLLRITNQINQLIAKSTDTDELFQHACELITQDSDYSLAWIGLWDKSFREIQPIAKAGSKVDALDQIISPNGTVSPERCPSVAALQSGKAIIDRKELEKTRHFLEQSG